jgi:hypothetical protein
MIILKKERVCLNEQGFTKDITPYLVFKCNKCQQYSYVKTTQKSKKCLRCGRSYQVIMLLNSGIIVNGMTAAVNKVKELQNQLGSPQFRTESEFTVVSKDSNQFCRSNIKLNTKIATSSDGDEEYLEKFNLLLKELSQRYTSFPLYLIEVMALNYDIPNSILKELICKFITNKTILKNNDNYYSFRLSQ